jgi:hypothetical protein
MNSSNARTGEEEEEEESVFTLVEDISERIRADVKRWESQIHRR